MLSPSLGTSRAEAWSCGNQSAMQANMLTIRKPFDVWCSTEVLSNAFDVSGLARVLYVVDALAVRRPGHHDRSEEHTSELQSRLHLVCRLLLEKKNGRCGAGGRRTRLSRPRCCGGPACQGPSPVPYLARLVPRMAAAMSARPAPGTLVCHSARDESAAPEISAHARRGPLPT